MMHVTLDFETYYDREYSLSRMTTEEYLRDRRFETIGVGIKVEDQPTIWFTGDKPYIAKKLSKLPWDNVALLAHNTKFDAGILAWHYDIHPKILLDTMCMGRPVLGVNASVSLANMAKHFGLGEKGNEVVNAIGKRRADFTPEEMQRYGGYCINDVELCKAIYDRILEDGFPLSELKLIDLTLKMFTEPVLRLDPVLLSEHLSDLKRDKKQLLVSTMQALGRDDLAALAAIGDEAGEVEASKILRSDAQFAGVLESLNIDPPTKISAKTGKMAFAFAKTDDGFKDLLEHEDTRVQALASARLGVKTTIEESRTERFLGISKRGSFPIPLKYYAAHPGRWGGEDKINMQNLSARGKHGGKLKRSIKPPEGYIFIDCDSSQIEARVLAWEAGQEDLVQAFREKRDVYSEMASTIYRRPVDRKRVERDAEGKEFKPDEKEGFVGKTTILGAGYGMGGDRFKIQLRAQTGIILPVEETKRIVNVYRDTYSRIPLLWKEAGACLDAMAAGQTRTIGRNGLLTVTPQGIQLPNGFFIFYPELHKRDGENGYKEYVYKARNGWNRIYGPKVVENFTQALARIIVGEQMLRVARRYKVVLTVHDSVGCIAPIEQSLEAKAYVEECMRWIPTWAEGLPIDCESGAGLSYGAC